MSSKYHYATNHIFTNSDGSQNATINIKPGIGETLNIEGNVTGSIDGNASGISAETTSEFTNTSGSFTTYFGNDLTPTSVNNEKLGEEVSAYSDGLMVVAGDYDPNLSPFITGGAAYYKFNTITNLYEFNQVLQPNVSCGGSPTFPIDYYKSGSNEIMIQKCGGEVGIMESADSGTTWTLKNSGAIGTVPIDVACIIDKVFYVQASATTFQYIPKTAGVYSLANEVSSATATGTIRNLQVNSNYVYCGNSNGFVDVFLTSDATLLTTLKPVVTDSTFGKKVAVNSSYVFVLSDTSLFIYSNLTSAHNFITSFNFNSFTGTDVTCDRSSGSTRCVILASDDTAYFMEDLRLVDTSTKALTLSSTNKTIALSGQGSGSLTNPGTFINGNFEYNLDGGIYEGQFFTFPVYTESVTGTFTDVLSVTDDNVSIFYRGGLTVTSTLKDIKLGTPNGAAGGTIKAYSSTFSELYADTASFETISGNTSFVGNPAVTGSLTATGDITATGEIGGSSVAANTALFPTSLTAFNTSITGTLGVSGTATHSGILQANSNIVCTNTTQSTTPSNGSVLFSGGLGIQKNIFSGGLVQSANPKFKAYVNGATAPTTSTVIQITPFATVFDTASGFSTNQYTIPTGAGGYWHVGFQFSILTNTSGGYVGFNIRVNGTTRIDFLQYFTSTGVYQHGNMNSILSLSASDVITVHGNVNGGLQYVFNGAAEEASHIYGYLLC